MTEQERDDFESEIYGMADYFSSDDGLDTLYSNTDEARIYNTIDDLKARAVDYFDNPTNPDIADEIQGMLDDIIEKLSSRLSESRNMREGFDTQTAALRKRIGQAIRHVEKCYEPGAISFSKVSKTDNTFTVSGLVVDENIKFYHYLKGKDLVDRVWYDIVEDDDGDAHFILLQTCKAVSIENDVLTVNFDDAEYSFRYDTPQVLRRELNKLKKASGLNFKVFQYPLRFTIYGDALKEPFEMFGEDEPEKIWDEIVHTYANLSQVLWYCDGKEAYFKNCENPGPNGRYFLYGRASRVSQLNESVSKHRSKTYGGRYSGNYPDPMLGNTFNSRNDTFDWEFSVEVELENGEYDEFCFSVPAEAETWQEEFASGSGVDFDTDKITLESEDCPKEYVEKALEAARDYLETDKASEDCMDELYSWLSENEDTYEE